MLVTLLLPCALKFSEGITMLSVPFLLEQVIGSVLFSKNLWIFITTKPITNNCLTVKFYQWNMSAITIFVWCHTIVVTFDGWFGLVKNLLPQTSGDIIFFARRWQLDDVRFFFSSTISNEKYFSSMQKLFPPGISLQELFFPRNQFAGYIFLKSPIPSPTQKSNGWPIKT